MAKIKLSSLNLNKFYVGGKWVKPFSSDSIAVVNPANEEVIGKIFLADAHDVDSAVQAAKKAFNSYSQTSKTERISLLEKLLQLSKEHKEELAWAMTLEMGAPITMSREAQAETGIGHLEAFIQALRDHDDQYTLANGDTVLREPIGVCGLITPWNWPINQIALKVIPALATGCTCVLKPSEYTPLSANLYAQLIHKAGFPPGVFNLIHGSGSVAGETLSQHSDLQMISFTGSTRAGKAVSRNACENIKRVTLELGGKSPNILFEDCDLESAIAYSLDSCFYNSGQSCDAPTRLLVQKSIYDQALVVAEKYGEKIELGDPSKEGPHLGPLYNRIQYDRVQSLIQIGINEGCKILFGGPGKPEGFKKGHYARPTLFYDVSNQKRIAREEIFGPVLVMIPFEEEEEGVAIANDTPYGLAAYVQTRDKDRALRVAKQLRAGSVYVNQGGFNYGSPFGGYKESGNGREGGVYGLEDYQELKSLHIGT